MATEVVQPAENPLDAVCQLLRASKVSKLFKERQVVVLHELMTAGSALKARLLSTWQLALHLLPRPSTNSPPACTRVRMDNVVKLH